MSSRGPSSLRRKVLQPWVVMPVAAVLALGGWYVARPEDPATSTEAVASTDQLVAATVGSMARTVSAEGTVAAGQSEDLSFASAGTVTAVSVSAGDTVTAGQVLATIDSAELEAAVSEAEAAVAEAEATLADDTEAGASDAQLEADASSLAATQDDLTAAQEALAGARLVAGFDGTVSLVDLSVGEELGSGGTSGTSATGSASGSGQSSGTLGAGATGQGVDATATDGAAAQIQVVSTDRFTVELGFDDTDIADLAVGQEATVALSTSSSSIGGFPGAGAFPGGLDPDRAAAMAEAVGGGGNGAADPGASSDDADAQGDTDVAASGAAGAVLEVGQVADASTGVASYPVTVGFTDDSGDYDPGATVSVEITYDRVEDVVQVPARAVTTTDGASTVTVDADGEAGGSTEERTVTTGLTSGTMVEVSSGLAEGEFVLIELPGRVGGTGTTDGGGTGGPTPPAGFDPSQAPGMVEGAGS